MASGLLNGWVDDLMDVSLRCVGRRLKMMKQMIAVTEKGIKLTEKSQAIEVDCNISLEVPGGYAGQYYSASVAYQFLTSLTTVDVQNRFYRLSVFSILPLHSSYVTHTIYLPFSQTLLIS
jgi:hypothetical protein